MSTLITNAFTEQLEVDDGYFLGLCLQQDELNIVRSLVKHQWLGMIKKYVISDWEKFAESGMENYHQHSHLLSHTAIWGKINRILPQKAVDVIRATSLIKKLEEHFGSFEIPDEENSGREEICWRLVRPNEEMDMGPLHADAWFWELGHGTMPPNRKRTKVWVALYCEPGKNGLQIVPRSHRHEWKYHGEMKHGFTKPVIDEDVSQLPVELVYTKPGDAIVFHDKLLHGGALNCGNKTRVSLEFTMLVKKQ